MGPRAGADIRELVVGSTSAPVRLDTYVAEHVPELSRSRVAQLLAEGMVRVNGEILKKSHTLRSGDRIEIRLPDPEPSGYEPENIPLEIVHEDSDLMVIDKPAGMVVHPASGHRSGTLVNALLYHATGLSGIGGVKRPGIVHRLDRDTSGLLIVAKNDASHRKLAGAMKQRRIRRVYLAAVWGHMAKDRITIDAPIGRSTRDRQRMTVTTGGRRAVTHIRRLERWVAADFLQVELETGRTHQIRVHLLSAGHPVVGDGTYGAGGERGISGPGRVWAREFSRRVPRQFLHAARLVFPHPRDGTPLDFTSSLPADLQGALDWVRGAP